MDELVIECVDLIALLVLLAENVELLLVLLVDLALLMQHLYEPVGVQQHLQDRPEELPYQPNGGFAAAIQIVGVNGVLLRLKGIELAIAGALELLDEIGADAFGIEKPLELDVGQLLNLLFGVVDTPLGLNARPNLAHDLFDVDSVGSNVEFCHSFRGLTPYYRGGQTPFPLT